MSSIQSERFGFFFTVKFVNREPNRLYTRRIIIHNVFLNDSNYATSVDDDLFRTH